MRILLGAVVLAALGWSLYWVLGAWAVERGTRDWFAARAAEGWVVGVGAVSVHGFPNRFDLRIADLDVADPETGLAWSVPRFEVLALSYRPREVIAVWPETQVIATPEERITVTSGDMRASAALERGPDRVLDRATMTFDSVGLSSTAGWSAALAGGQLALRRTPAAPRSYDIAFSARDLTVPSRWLDILSRRGLVSEVAEGAEVAATVQFDRVWDRRAIEERRPQPTDIRLDLARATWGELNLRMAGDLAVSPAGTPDGAIAVQATNWREMLALAQVAGLLPEAAAGMAERGLEALAGLSGNPATLDLPLTVSDGRVTLGGVVPLGRAPNLRLR